jgi:hypothetical protein
MKDKAQKQMPPLLGLLALMSVNPQQVLADASPNPLPSSCQHSTGGGANSLIGASQAGKYECAYAPQQNDASIGGYKSHSWTQSTVPGYSNIYDCAVASSSAVWLTRAYAGSSGTGPNPIGGSLTWSAYNSISSTRHWGAGVLWSTTDNGGPDSSQWRRVCNGTQGYIPANFLYLSQSSVTSAPSSVVLGTVATIKATVTMPYGGPTPSNTVYLYQQKDSTSGAKANPKTDWILGNAVPVNGVATFSTKFGGQDASGNKLSAVPGNVLIYATYQGTDQTTQPIGWTGFFVSQTASQTVTLSATAPAVTAALTPVTIDLGTTASATAPAAATAPTQFKVNGPSGLTVIERTYPGSGRLTISCPTGTVPVHGELMSPQVDMDGYLSHVKLGDGSHRVVVQPPADAGQYLGATSRLQLLCRDQTAPVVNEGGVGHGTPYPDTMATNVEGNTLFGGLSGDTLSVDHAQGIAFGGPGNDAITLSAAGAAAGGEGNDYIEATTAEQTVMDGGPGADVLIGGPGVTLINARDGKGGDLITCQSAANSVISDEGDTLVGPCTPVVANDYE